MRGPGGRRPMGGKRSKNPKKTLNRLMKYIGKGYGIQFGVVLICICSNISSRTRLSTPCEIPTISQL
jgi:hypothetical protein